METAIIKSISPGTFIPEFRTVTVYSDCMVPKLNPGQMIRIALVEKYDVVFGQPYLVEFIDGQVFIKYIKKGKDDNHWILANENPRYQETEFRFESIINIFEISGIITMCRM